MADYQLTQTGAQVQSILNTIFGREWDYQFINAITDLGLSSGATLNDICTNMPANSICIIDASTVSGNDRPTQYATMIIIKHASSLTRLVLFCVSRADGAAWVCSGDDIASPKWRRIAVGGSNVPEGFKINGRKVPSIFTKSYSGTTDANGYLTTDLGNGTYVPFMGRSSTTDHVVEFSTGASVWWMHIIKNNANVANTSVTVNVWYFDYNTSNP